MSRSHTHPHPHEREAAAALPDRGSGSACCWAWIYDSRRRPTRTTDKSSLTKHPHQSQMAASPRSYGPLRSPAPGTSSLLRRLLKYLAAGVCVYVLGYRHGALQTPTVPAGAAAAAVGGSVQDGSGSSSKLRSQQRPPPPIRPEDGERQQQQRGWAGEVGAIRPVAANHAVDDWGRAIEKQVMVPPGTIPAVTGFSRAVLRPTQIVQRHAHATMHELFYVEAGRGVFMINDLPHVVGNGSFVHLPPGEAHAVLNSEQDAEAGADLVLLYFGVAVDGR